MSKGALAKKLVDLAARNTEKAKQAGFDTSSWYHGSDSNFISEIDPKKLGVNTGTPGSKQAFFLADNPDQASGFGKHLHEFFYRPGRNTSSVNWSDHFGDVPIRSNNGQKLLAGLIDDAKEIGLAGIRITGAKDTAKAGQKAGDILAVIDPERIRYPNAAFENIKSKSTLAGGAAVLFGLNDAAEASQGKRFTKSLEQLRQKYDQQFMGKPLSYAQAPVNPQALEAAKIARSYNQWRKDNVHPVLDLILPVGELPADLWERSAYGDNISYLDSLKASLGVL